MLDSGTQGPARFFRPNELRQGVLLSGSETKAEGEQEDAPRHDLREGTYLL